MKLFLDTANVAQIREAARWGVLDGVTTNPSLVAKEKRPFHELVREICGIVAGPVSAETVSLEAGAIVAEGRQLAKLHERVVVKVPVMKEGLAATRALAAEGIRVNMTLVFSPAQVLLAAKAGAAYISPFVGRLDDAGHTGMEMVEQSLEILRNYDFAAEIIVASVRSPLHVAQAAILGAHIATIPFAVLEQLVRHPLTDVGIEKFLADARTIPQAAG
ncbi:MAG TPA: fructose-6-phosphate aldolase [Candidatus Methanoperedens sp.]|nr:fructose-6-phosphate aldolase [Candidatus Methanoperedens sp.]